MEKIKIRQLIEQCLDYFKTNCYTVNRIYRYKSLWKTGIVRYMKAKNIEYYTLAIGSDFVETCHYDGTIRPQERDKIRSIQVLDDMLTRGHIRKRCITPVFHPLEGEIGHQMEKLVTHMSNLRRSKTTISDYRLYLSEFLYYLTSAEVNHVNEIAERHILAFVSSHPTNKVNIVSALRVLFRFWKQEHIFDDRFDNLFDTYKVRKQERVPSFYTAKEIMTVENSISRSSSVGKRNYAMVLLASRLGLRASDIAGLQFNNIDWDKNLIIFKMQKTQKMIELPLLADVGNAIIDYLQHGRPKSSLQNVFLSSRAPYVEATKACVCAAINTIICHSGIDTGGKHHGPHSLRHSLATTMLSNGTILPVISETLGHKSTQTTMSYLKIDIASLQKCALPVPSVPNAFYMQKGGAFYE
jgi:Site-specific recombinase XerD